MTVFQPTLKQLQYLVALHEHGHFGRDRDGHTDGDEHPNGLAVCQRQPKRYRDFAGVPLRQCREHAVNACDRNRHVDSDSYGHSYTNVYPNSNSYWDANTNSISPTHDYRLSPRPTNASSPTD